MEAGIRSATSQQHPAAAWLIGGAAAALVVVAVAVGLYFWVFTMSVTVDGRTVRLPSNAKAAELFARDLVARKRGNLVSVKRHKVLRAGAGGPAYVTVSGRVLDTSTPLAASSVVISHDGTDAVEPTHVETETIDMPVTYQGSGPVEDIITQGSDGVREITVGTLSGEVVRKKTKVAAIAQVVRRSPLYKGAKTVALTFDDGPWPGSTKAILAILKQYGVTATFFEIGRQARQMPSLSRSVAAAGMELGNHSETHPLNLGRLSAGNVANEITRAEADITKASGRRPAFFRPPGGNTTPAMYPVLAKLGMSWIQWDVDTDDWRRPGADKIAAKVLANVRPGSVVLMHDGGGDRSQTVKALPVIIQKLKAQGYVFVPVSALKRIPHRMG